MSPRRWSLWAVVLGFLSLPALGVTLQQPAVSIIRVTHSPCFVHPDHTCSVALYPEPARLMPAGGSGWFQSTMNTGYPGWTLANGGTLSGTLRITQYDAYNDDNPGGAEFHMFFDKGAGDPADVDLTQGILTNHRRTGPAGTWASYMDVIVDADPATHAPPLYPYQHPRPGYVDGEFYDKPSRPCPADSVILWVAEMYVTVTNFATTTMTIYDGVEWGFIYSCFGRTPVGGDDGSGTTGSTTGTRDGTVLFNPGSEPFTGWLTLSGPINVMNTDGSSALAPEFATDPLQSCTMQIGALQMVGPPDESGGYQFIFPYNTSGPAQPPNFQIVGPNNELALVGNVLSLYCNDQMFGEAGVNMIAIYGDLFPLNEIGSEFMSIYANHLSYMVGHDFYNIPKMTVATNGPFSQVLGDGTFDVFQTGTVLHGYSTEHGGSIFDLGDMNCDGIVNNADIAAFVEALINPATYAINYPDCPMIEVGDCNGDGEFNNADIPAFIEILTGG